MTEPEVMTFIGAAAMKATAILGIAGIVTTMWRSSSAAARHLVWTLAVISAVTLPLLTLLVQRTGAPSIEIAAWKTPAEPVVSTSIGLNESESARAEPTGKAASLPIESAKPEMGEATPAPSVTHSVSGSSVVRQDIDAVGRAGKRDWIQVVFLLWVSGAFVSLLPLLFAFARVRLLEERARRLTASRWSEIISETPTIAHLAKRVRVIESDATAMPMTWGILKPTLLVPSSSARWSDWQCRHILLHELAHVERRDCLTQLVAQLACGVYWFNPLIWVAAHRMRIERELACDDRVLSAGSRASDYAANLLDVARTLRAPSYTSQTAIAMARPSQLSGRLLAVLDSKRNRRGVTRRVATSICFAALSVALVFAVMTPAAQTAKAAVIPASIPSIVKAALFEMPRAAEPMVTTVSEPGTFAAPVTEQIRLAALPALSATEQSVSSLLLSGPKTTEPLPLIVAQDPVCWAEGEGSTNISVNDDNKSGRNPSVSVRYSRDNCSMEMRAEGRFTLRSDLSDLETIDSNGWFRIEERTGRSSRRMEIRRADNGSLDHQYWVNGDRAPYNDEARAWLGRILLAVERRTAFAAETRVPQLYRTGGLRGVLSEISLMPSAYAKSRYYGSLLDMDIRLDATTLNNVVRQVAVDLTSSDYYMSEVLSKFSNQPAANEATWRAFAEAAGRMKSDYYKSQTLKKVLTKGTLSEETVGVLLKSASGMKSDYYLSDLLKDVADKFALNAQTRPYYVDALRNIESDYYRGEVIKAIGTEGEWDAQTSRLVLASIADIKSDYYRSEALVSLIKGRHVSDWPAFFSAASGIGSEHYKRETLIAALRQRPLNNAIAIGALGVAARMRSDNEISEVLNYVSRNYRIDDTLRPAFDKAVDAINSDYYRGSVLSSMRRNSTQ
jgi:beta-lactamase regulating signal transducer with metallopeptidase domain